MRVTAGKFKGRVLVQNKFEHIRPTADMVKQALMNKLNDLLVSSRVLDLCAGTGAVGIEAISRGAKEVVFVDKDSRSVSLIKQNLANLGVQARVIRCDAKEFCKSYSGEPFDIIFFDPPYQSDLYKTIPNLLTRSILAEDGIIACEHAKKDEIDFGERFLVVDEKVYGIKKITYLKLKKSV